MADNPQKKGNAGFGLSKDTIFPMPDFE